jgi:hypothetical protein
VTCKAGFHPCFKSRKKTKMVWYLCITSINSNHHSAFLISGTTGLIIKSKHSCKILHFILISRHGVVSLYIILNFYMQTWASTHTGGRKCYFYKFNVKKCSVLHQTFSTFHICLPFFYILFLLASILSCNLYHNFYTTFK